jgi:hypothetical protein
MSKMNPLETQSLYHGQHIENMPAVGVERFWAQQFSLVVNKKQASKK